MENKNKHRYLRFDKIREIKVRVMWIVIPTPLAIIFTKNSFDTFGNDVVEAEMRIMEALVE